MLLELQCKQSKPSVCNKMLCYVNVNANNNYFNCFYGMYVSSFGILLQKWTISCANLGCVSLMQIIIISIVWMICIKVWSWVDRQFYVLREILYSYHHSKHTIDTIEIIIICISDTIYILYYITHEIVHHLNSKACYIPLKQLLFALHSNTYM